MTQQQSAEITALIERSKQLIAQLNELLKRAGAPIRFAAAPAEQQSPENRANSSGR